MRMGKNNKRSRKQKAAACCQQQQHEARPRPSQHRRMVRRPKSIHQYCAKGSPTNTLKALWCICIFLLFPLKTSFLVYTKPPFLPVDALEFSELKTPLVYTFFPPNGGATPPRCSMYLEFRTVSVAPPAQPRGEKTLFFVQSLGGEKLLKFVEKCR